MNTTLIILIVAFVVVVAIVGYFNLRVTKEFVLNEQKKTLLELQKVQQAAAAKVITPVQLQAYERLTLFLERMQPDNLVLRCYQPNMDTKLLKDVMVQNIRDEYEHNLSQQLYISASAWELIKNAKEEMIGLINSTFSSMKDDKATPTAFAGKMFESLAGKKTPIELALGVLKEEIQKKFA